METKTKFEVVALFLRKFEEEFNTLIVSAKAAHEAATHEETQAEDQHDTRAIEASYLAAGQSARLVELEKVMDEFKKFLEFRNEPVKHVAPGSLVQLSSQGKTFFSFFARLGGGTQIQWHDQSVTVTTESSPLGEELLDLKAGDEVEIDTKNGSRAYRVLQIQ